MQMERGNDESLPPSTWRERILLEATLKFENGEPLTPHEERLAGQELKVLLFKGIAPSDSQLDLLESIENKATVAAALGRAIELLGKKPVNPEDPHSVSDQKDIQRLTARHDRLRKPGNDLM